jgi:glycerol kinase
MNDVLLLALDQGTTSSRAIVFDRAGAVRAVSQRPLTATFPHPGWVNQDANEIVDSIVACAKDVLAAPGIRPDRIAAVGITNQRETTILWDRGSGEPVAPAIVWQSRQSAPQVEAIARRGMTERYQEITGLVPDAYFSGTKIAWLLDHDPALRRRSEAGEILFGTVETWLLWRLSGGAVHVSDIANASRTMLLDLHTLDWCDELLADLAIPRAMLPRVVGSAEPLAQTDSTLLGVSLPVLAAAGDQQAALFGQACLAPGQAKNTYGTGSFLLMNVGHAPRRSAHRLLSTVAWRLGAETTYALEGAIFVTGSAVQWLRDGLGIIPDAPAVEALAASVSDSDGVLFVPALTGLGAPWWDADARGTVLGLTRGSTAAHLARATLEAIAFQTRDIVDAMVADAGVPLRELRVDGGGSRNDLLMQIQADLLGVPVVRAANAETTALGAAALAGLAAGVYASPSDFAATWRADRVFEPAVSRDERDARHGIWKRAVDRARGWATEPDSRA